MPYKYAQALTEVYGSTQAFSEIEEKIGDYWIQLSVLNGNIDQPSDEELHKGGDLRIALSYQTAAAID